MAAPDRSGTLDAPAPRSAAPTRPSTLRDEFRATIRARALAQAAELTLEQGWQQVRLAELARRAQMSRATIYREFGDKGGLARALVAREADQLLLRTRQELEGSRSWQSGLLGALEILLGAREDQPLIGAVLEGRHGNTDLLPLLTTRSGRLLAGARALLTVYLRAHHPQLDRDTLDDIADALVRATMSHLATPAPDGSDTADRLHRLAQRLLLGVPAPRS